MANKFFRGLRKTIGIVFTIIFCIGIPSGVLMIEHDLDEIEDCKHNKYQQNAATAEFLLDSANRTLKSHLGGVPVILMILFGIARWGMKKEC